MVDQMNSVEIGQTEARLRNKYGVHGWYGIQTRRWWAVHDQVLLEAATPTELVELVMEKRRAASRPGDPGLATGSPTGGPRATPTGGWGM